MEEFLEGQEHFGSRREGEALSKKPRLGGGAGGGRGGGQGRVALSLTESWAERRSGSQVQSFPTSLRRFRQKSMQLRQKSTGVPDQSDRYWGAGEFLQSNEPVSMQHEREKQTLFDPFDPCKCQKGQGILREENI